MLITLAFV